MKNGCGLGCLGLIFLAAIGSLLKKDEPAAPIAAVAPIALSPEEKERKAKESAALFARNNPDNAMKITKFSWETGGFGSVMIASFTVQNDNPFPVKDIDVICNVSAASGTSLGSTAQTIFDIVPGKSSKRFSKVNFGFINQQASKAGCRILQADVAE